MNAPDLAAAIATIEFCRLVHVEWADWLRDNPADDRADIAGDRAWHERFVREYDNVLAVLGSFH